MKRIPCTACKEVPPADKASGKVKCRECNNAGYIDVNDTGCTHPDEKCEFEPAVGGWSCICGASGPL